MDDGDDGEEKARKIGQGISREHLQGKLQDPSGVDIWGANDQEMPAGGEGLEGGSAGKFTRPYHEGEARRSGPGPRG